MILPIVLDIETSGTDYVKCGIWQIGAIDLSTMEEFIGECRIDEEDKIIDDPNADKKVLEVIGKTEEELRDKNKKSQKELISKFLGWVENRTMRNFLCENPQFDVAFLEIKAIKYGLKMPFHHRSFDLHTFGQRKYLDLHGDFLVKEGHSDMGLSNILKLCGLEDNRKAHNALEDAKLTGECFYRLIEGKNLFPEYSKYSIPEVLRK